MCKKPLILDHDRIVKCGHCIECLIQRSQEWAFRVEQESKQWTQGAFITLTYNDENAIWLVNEDDELLTTLDKRDFQLFMKRLRKKCKKYTDLPLRYFACGEYGETYNRAHYHLILFNIPNQVKNTLCEVWQKGYVKVGDVTPKSIRYVTNYMLLKDNKIKKGQSKPFVLMSRRPGLGQAYIKNSAPYHFVTGSPWTQTPGDRKIPLPKYYFDKIVPEEQQEEAKQIKIDHYQKFIDEREKEAKEKSPKDPGEFLRKQKDHKEKIFNHRRKKGTL